GLRENRSRAIQPDDIIFERLATLVRRGDFAIFLAGDAALGFFADDVVAQLHAFIADEHGGAGDQLAHLVLRLAAEAAVESALAVGTAEFGHILVHVPDADRKWSARGFAPGNLALKVSISIVTTLI